MWNNEQKNTTHRGQNMNFESVGSQVPFLHNMRFQPPTNGSGTQFFPAASRKRKNMDAHLGGYACDGVSSSLENLKGTIGHPVQEEYTLQKNEVLPCAVVSQTNTCNLYFNHNLEYAKANNSESHHGNYQFYAAENSLLRSEANKEFINKSPFSSLQPLCHSQPSFQFKLPVKDMHRPNDSQHLVYDPASQPEPGKFSSYFGQDGGPKEMSGVSLSSTNCTNLGHENNNLPCNPYPWTPSKTLSFMNSSQPKMVDAQFQADGGTVNQNFSRSGPVEVRGCNRDTWFSEGGCPSIARRPTMNSAQTSVTCEKRESYDFSQYHNTGIRSGDFISNDNISAHLLNVKKQSGETISQLPESSISIEACPENRMVNNSTQACKESDTEILKNGDTAVTETKHDPLVEEASLVGNNSLASISTSPSDGLPLNIEEQRSSVTGKGSLMTVEKLWDGTLQLNTSTVVSAVAFFKSGEKAQDFNWSERVEIKGKVRLQAFEKFIQELPRSRNRALMVISLCWKAGSSKAGLTGIKEVAKGYRDSEKVGFAQICPGVDLYVCPRSDAIITILAKYGFFKGMAAVVEDQDSLIGCIVWRRGNITSNTVSKIPERKKVPSPEPSVLEMNSPAMAIQESESKQEKPPSSLVLESRLVPLESTGPKMTESMVIKSNNDSSDGLHKIGVLVPENSVIQLSSEKKLDSTYFPENAKYSEVHSIQAVDAKHDAGAEPKKHPTHNQFSTGLHSLNNYYSSPSPERRDQLTMTQKPDSQKPDSSFVQKPMQSDPKSELRQPVLPGPPPLLPDLLQKITQFKKDACKVPSDGASDAHSSFVGLGGLTKSVVGFEAKQRTDWDDDDGDLPEFDFDAACGVSKAPASNLNQSTHHIHLPVDSFNNQLPVDEVKHVDVPIPLPILKPVEVAHKQQDSSFPGKPWNTYQGTTNSQTLKPEFTVKTDSNSLSQKSCWDDDDDDMPEWCPPELDCVDLHAVARMPLPVFRPGYESAAARPPLIPSPSEAFYGSSPRSQASHGYQPGLLGPFSPLVDPSLHVKPRPVTDFIQPYPRPPPLPSPNYSTMPRASNFSTRPFNNNRR